MRKILIVCMLLIAAVSNINGQLAGKVIAANNKQPIPSASVFLSNTSVGTISNEKGEFLITRLPAGRFDLVVSCVGYETEVQSIFSNQLPSSLVIALKPKAKELDEVIVEQYDKNGWDRWGSFFLENFIGTSDLAKDCKLKNYKAVKFKYSKKLNLLKAFADEALIIENKSLGYHVTYQLTKFEYNFSSHVFYYQGYPLFQEMESKRKNQLKRWAVNREDAYYGSLMHFMRCVFRNTLIEEGYQVRRLKKIKDEEKERVKGIYQNRVKSQLGNGKTISLNLGDKDSSDYYSSVMRRPDGYDAVINKVLSGDSIAYAIDSVTAGLVFEDYLLVAYTKRRDPAGYKDYSKNKDSTGSYGTVASQIYLPNKRGIAVLANGSYYEGMDLITMEFWAWWEKLATMLPFDYWPAKK
ncbi:carboxypeptidase-like regulatory domain-containing protein [Chitinophagaceae bacterium LWZ2-11]